MGEPWISNFFGCCGNVPVCCFVMCCPGGHLALHLLVTAEVQHSCIIPYCLYWYLGCYGLALNRMKFREFYEIQGNYCLDLLAWYFCPCCSAMQEYRESVSRYKEYHRKSQNGPTAIVGGPQSVGPMPATVAIYK